MNIYFAGSIRSGREKAYDYQKMVNRFEANGHNVLTKHVGDPNLPQEGEGIPLDKIFERDTKWIKEADLFFADITIGSIGVGYEICYAESHGKKVYVAYEKDANVSGFIQGNKNLNFLPYESVDEVLEYIDKICQNT